MSFALQQQIERDLASLQGTYCPTVAEKYQLLLKRDNLLQLLAKLRPQSKSRMLATSKMGNCIDMCNEKERYCRQLGNLLHPYECTPDGKLDPALAVKDYSRSAADQDEPLLHELRPPPILKKTMDYLILMMDKPMSRSELPRWYDFTWSRTRAIRKEITQQIIVDEVTVSLVEKCARFHIYASYCMSDLDSKVFDKRMNIENLSKCLQTLRHMYDDLSKKSIFCESEPEFRAYDILLNLGDSNVLSSTHTYHRSVRNAPMFKLAMKLACAYQTDNFVLFFRLIREQATFLQACLCRSFFDQIRAKALHTVAKVSRPPTILVSKLTRLLAFDNDEDIQSFMKALDMYPKADGMVRYGDGYQLFSEVSDGKTTYGCEVIREKIHDSISTIIAGGRVQAPKFNQPVNSFVMDYYGRPPTGRRRN
ncbi:SAC3-GANP domain-containing protein [Aphelenchoides bicaudatus]|nr:SAC3-GANP domain-containing protein [Aphelenchoides bicaudatus]